MPGLSTAVAHLLKSQRSLVETEMLPRILEMNTKSSLDCLYECLKVGGVYRLVLTAALQNIGSEEETRVEIITRLAQYDPEKGDFEDIEDKAAELVVILLREVCPSWTASHQHLCKLLSDLGSALTVSSWQEVEDAVREGGVTVYSSSVMGSV